LKKKRIYLAGPMSGVPYFNFPEFDRTRDFLKDGWKVVSPADIDRDYGFDPRHMPEDSDWHKIPPAAGTRSEIIRRDIDALLSCHAIYMMPGWRDSKGARAEFNLAVWKGLQLFGELDHVKVEHQMDGPPTEWKDTNPKDSVGCTKPPLHCIPTPVLFEVGMGMYEGGWKYREANWRVIGVRASIYYDAALRHLTAWWDGEDIDPASKIHHISKVMSCLAVLRDCQMQAENGSGVDYKDDRPPKSYVPMNKLEDQFKVMLSRLQAEHGDRKPPYTEAKA
jgi:hypothetical protein